MVTLLLCLALLLLLLGVRSLQKTYRHLPLKELRRRARSGDDYAAVIFKVSSYGIGADILLWVLVAVCSALLFLIVATHLSGWLALLVMSAVLFATFGVLPSLPPGRLAKRSALLSAKPLSKLLMWLVPLNSRLAILARKLKLIRVHTGLYEKEDLVELLDRQKTQIDNRISEQELAIARGALQFGDKMISDVLTPRRMVKTVNADEPISPHIMDELHGSGFSRFPVLGEGNELVGTLYLKDLINHGGGGTVRDVMKPEVFYVHESGSLLHALNAFIKTKHHLFIVVNNFEEIVGVLSIEDVLENLLGDEIVDEFDRYDNLRAVASMEAETEHKQRTQASDQ